ncbi:MAG: TIGR03936 family radical SAM-associated protein [Eubacteriales bacterium]|nr:TIGR03936 family radical SAM-associated protein [Eubacteriales bacterium]
MKLIAAYQKGNEIAMISHLDIQRTLQRTFRRAGIPLLYSNGFNPHPQFSFATAAATGMSSSCEWFEVQLSEEIAPEEFERRANAVMPQGMHVSGSFVVPENFGSLSAKLRAAEYRVDLQFDEPVSKEKLDETLATMLAGEIIIQKRTKGGIRPVDMRPYILRVSVGQIEGEEVTLLVLGKLQADGGLRVDALIDALLERLDAHAAYEIHRTNMYFAEDGLLPHLPVE